MAIPNYQAFMVPLLRLASDGQEHTISDALAPLAAELGISEEEQNVMLPSGTQTRLYNRAAWAVTYLTKSGLLERAGRGRYRITQRGLDALKANPSRIDARYLEQFPEYQAFMAKRGQPDVAAGSEAERDAESESTPEERLEAAHEELRDALADELLQRVRSGTPKAFEHLVLRLLLAMGYGRGQLDRAKVTGMSGDDGIDGVIAQDRLELDMVYIQAKRHENTVGPGEIDKFVGSLMRKRATKGVFITSGSFTEGAVRAGREAAVKLRLIDGDELAALMIDFNVGVSVAETYIVKRPDNDFFDSLPS